MTNKKIYAYSAAAVFAFLGLFKMWQRKEAIDLIARTAWGEDYIGGVSGMQAVINVIENRLKSGKYGKTWQDVILKPYQFSIWNAKTVPAYKENATFQRYLSNIMNVDEKNADFAQAKKLAARGYDGTLPDLTSGSTHYKLPSVTAEWARGKYPVAHVGSHDFYNDIE